jgi:tetratricopeptide (TPR) repeat protein
MDTPSLTQLIDKAKNAYEAEDFEQAAQWYEQAASQYTQLDDPINAAEMANNRSVSLLRNGNAQGALQAAQGTDQVFARAGDVHRQAMAIGNQASALEALHRTDEAIKLYQQSNELLKGINDQTLRVYVLQSLSGLQLGKRQYLQAMATMQAAMEIKSHLSFRERILKKLIQIVFKLLGNG